MTSYKTITSTISTEDITISRDVRHMNHHVPNMEPLHHTESRPSGPAEPSTCTVVTYTSSPSTTSSTSSAKPTMS